MNHPLSLTPGNPYDRGDMISVVSIAKTLTLHWRWAVAAFLVTFLPLLFLIYYQGDRYAYATIYKAAELAPGKTVLPLKGTEDFIRQHYADKIVRNLLEAQGLRKLPFTLDVTSSQESGLLFLHSVSSEKHAATIQKLHETIIQNTFENDTLFLENKKALLQRQVQEAREALTRLHETNPGSEVLAVRYMDKIWQAENQMAELRPGETLQQASRSLVRVSRKKKWILLCLISFGAGVMAPFCIELRKQIQIALEHEKATQPLP